MYVGAAVLPSLKTWNLGNLSHFFTCDVICKLLRADMYLVPVCWKLLRGMALFDQSE